MNECTREQPWSQQQGPCEVVGDAELLEHADRSACVRLREGDACDARMSAMQARDVHDAHMSGMYEWDAHDACMSRMHGMSDGI